MIFALGVASTTNALSGDDFSAELPDAAWKSETSSGFFDSSSVSR